MLEGLLINALALAVLMAPNGLQPLMTKAIAAATERGRQIAQGK